jgi:selenocysteine lyase/cysteine desulfurase
MLRELGELGVRTSESGDAGSGPLSALRLLGPRRAEGRVGVFSFAHDTIDPHELAAVLEGEFGIVTRAGLHCAPDAHRAMGTMDPGAGGAPRGAVRMSLGHFNTHEDVVYACRSLATAVVSLAPAHAATGS